MISLKDLKKQREELDRKIAAAKRKTGKKSVRKEKAKGLRKKYPGVCSSIDRAARSMWG